MLNFIYTVTAIFAACVIFAAILYIPKFRQIFGARRKPKRVEATEKRRIALVIPARNESRTIGALLNSILRQDYPADKFSVNIIVKDKDDPTVKMAEAVGAKVFVVPEQSCKGEALDGYFRALSDGERRQYAAFVIVDADAVLADDYVTELNNALEYGKQIYVTNKRVKNFLAGGKCHSWVTDCSALVYPILDELGNIYRSEKGVPLNLCGQGMMVTRDVIETLGGWPYRSLTEEYELKLDGFLHDFTMMYYPYAVIYTEEVLRHKDSYARRLRWIKGYAQCDEKYRARVVGKIKGGNCSSDVKFDLLHYKDAVAVYLAAAITTVIIGSVTATCSSVMGLGCTVEALWLLVVLPVALTYAIVFVYCAMAMFCARKGLKGFNAYRVVRTLAIAPLFIMEFIPMYITCTAYRGEEVTWQETARVNYSDEVSPAEQA